MTGRIEGNESRNRLIASANWNRNQHHERIKIIKMVIYHSKLYYGVSMRILLMRVSVQCCMIYLFNLFTLSIICNAKAEESQLPFPRRITKKYVFRHIISLNNISAQGNGA